MRQTSFTLEVLPCTDESGEAWVYVKTIDFENGEWGKVEYHLEKKIVVALNDFSPETKMFMAANLAGRISRMIMEALNDKAREERK
jgi:hypothetical protein